MPIPEVYFRWSITSTGAAKPNYGLNQELRLCRNLTFLIDANVAGDTATVGLESGPTDTGFFDRMGSTAYAISSGLSATVQFSGPLEIIRPYVITRTASTTVVNVTLLGN